MLCFVRQEGLSSRDFRSYWRSDEHHEKIASLVDLFAPDRWSDTLAADMPDLEEQFRKHLGRGSRYDAVLEFYWDDVSIVRDRLNDKAVSQILRVLKDQSIKRVDPDKSTTFFTEIPEIRARTSPSGRA